VRIKVSAQKEQAGKAVRAASAGRVKADGTRVYRLTGPQVIWWTWVGVVVLGLADLAFQGHDWISLKVAFGLLAATGLIYACALWPRVTADDDGIRVLNPVRCFRIPWGAVNGIFLADSVEVQCARQAPKPDKTVYSWALASPRRARARAELRGQQWDRGGRTRPSTYDRLPDPAKAVVKLTPAEVMAKELGQLSEEVRFRSASRAASASGPAGSAASGAGDQEADGLTPGQDAGSQPAVGGNGTREVMSAHWSWPPLAAFLLPAAALVAAALIR